MNTYVELICYIVVFVIEAMITRSYLSYLFSTKRSKLFSILSFFAGYAVLLYVSLSSIANFYTNTLSFVLINLIIMTLCYNTGRISALIHVGFLAAIMCISETIGLLILNIFVSDYSAYTYRLSVFIALLILSKALYLLLSMIGARLFSPHKNGTINVPMIFKLCLLPIASVFVSVTIAYIGTISDLPSIVQILISIGLVVLIVSNIQMLSIYNNMEAIHSENLSMQLSTQKENADNEYYKMLSDQYEQQRILIHDSKNHIQVINSLLEKGDYDVIKIYISSWIQDPGFRRHVKFCDNSILNIIIVKTLDDCKEKGIDFVCDVRNGSIDFLDDIDITSLFGNLLANAVEAACNSTNKYVDITVSYKPEQHVTLVSVVNSCSSAPKTDSNGLFISQKNDPVLHGIGQKSINKIVEKYDGYSNMYYDEEKQRFYAIISFPQH